jgi:DNA-directed RNA polymerase specialized sigma24 family protein
MAVDASEWDAALADFAGPGESRAEAAFLWLMEASMPMLQARLRQRLRRREDCEDVAVQVQLRVWRYRERFDNRGRASWLRFLKQVADRCLIDHATANRSEISLDDSDWGDVPATDLPVVDSLIDVLRDRDRLYAAADELWLGERTPDHDRRLFAAKLFYLDRLPWKAVCDLVRVDRATLDRWLGDPVVARYVAFDALYLGNVELASRLLGLAEASPELLNALAQEAAAPTTAEPPTPGRTWPEVFAILWRYRFAHLTEQIATHPNGSLDRKELEALFDRCRREFPFASIMSGLVSHLGKSTVVRAGLTETAFWRRLVFQYFAADELPHRDIHDRTSPAADVVGYHLTLGMLNVWLSNGRLFKALADHVSRTEAPSAR